MGKTTIEWTSTTSADGTVIPGYTFNPWIGCARVHKGCENCYAEADMDGRRGRVKWGPNGTRSRTSDAYWKDPLRWDRKAACTCNARLGASHMEAFASCPQHRPEGRPRVFCASLADVFEDWPGRIQDAHDRDLWVIQDGTVWPDDGSPGWAYGKRPLTMDDLRRDLFALIDRTPNLDWLLLTKRPENVRRMWDYSRKLPNHVSQNEGDGIDAYRPNVWLLTSVSDQATADRQIPPLLACRDLVSVLGLSCEPLLGPIHLRGFGTELGPSGFGPRTDCAFWCIVGGESGPDAPPMNLEWARSLVIQCREAGVACFVKQMGANAVVAGPPDGYQAQDQVRLLPLRLADRKGGDPAEWPEDLCVRQFPQPSTHP